ncbi:MAG: prepilin-type N-terminal cleavage/methylation domain-containing protein [Myxococcales bacterium]
MSAQRRSRAKQGVTLVELMIIVMIIAILAGAFGVSVRRTVLEQRGAAAARQITSLVRDAKLSASVLRVAHTVRFDPANGTVRVLHAANNSCLAANWEALNVQCANASLFGQLGTECTTMSLVEQPWSLPGGPTFRLRELLPDGTTPPGPDTQSKDVRLVCFSPNGTVYQSIGGGAMTSDGKTAGGVSLGGGFMFQIDVVRPGESDPSPDFVARQVLVPLNGMAKVFR